MSNREARNKDAVEFLKKEHDVVVSPELVSIVRTKLSLPKAKKVAKAKAKKVKTEKGESRSQLIRDFFEKNGSEARNRDAIEFLGNKGVTVTPELVSSVRARLGLKKPKKAKAAKVTKVAKTSDLPLTAILTRVLKGSRNGHKLAELADLALKAGYQYNGERGRDGVIQNVYQAVHGLQKKKSHPGWVGEMSVVIHDVESKRWKLNPKAKRLVA
jgi:hypothetical protein